MGKWDECIDCLLPSFIHSFISSYFSFSAFFLCFFPVHPSSAFYPLFCIFLSILRSRRNNFLSTLEIAQLHIFLSDSYRLCRFICVFFWSQLLNFFYFSWYCFSCISFGSTAIDNFLENNQLSYIIRAHEAHAHGVSLSKGARWAKRVCRTSMWERVEYCVGINERMVQRQT